MSERTLDAAPDPTTHDPTPTLASPQNAQSAARSGPAATFPERPEVPEAPELPEVPEVPGLPDTTDVPPPPGEPEPLPPEVPGEPEPLPPEVPGEPELPEPGPEAGPLAVAGPAVDAAAAVPRTIGRLVADILRSAGVRVAFTVPGDRLAGLRSALDDAGIRVVTARHEGGAVLMAEAYGQLTGRPAACLGTRAVDAADLSIGIHAAREDSTALFVLVGRAGRRSDGDGAFRAEPIESLGRLAKLAGALDDATAAGALLGDAVRTALGGRPGPVVLSLLDDLLDEPVPPGPPPDAARSPVPRPEVAEIRAALQFLASARRPVILAGGGVLRARTSNELTRLAELLHVPVIASWRRPDVVSNDHPLYLGMAGSSSPAVVRERLERADALLVLGCRLGESTRFGDAIPRPGQAWAHVDVEPWPAAAAHLAAPAFTIRADARAFVRAAVQRLQGAVLDAALVDARRAANDEDRRAWEAAAVVGGDAWDGPGIHPGRVLTTLRRVLPDDAIVTTDGGAVARWATGGFRFRRPGTFLGPTSGAVGYGLPAAIAAALVHRDRPIVALVGDGGLGMTMVELETAVRERARVVVLAFDTERYGTNRADRERRGDDGPPGDLGPIDFAAVARACGARGARVERDADFEAALRQALAADRPTVLHLALDRRWLSLDEPAS